jgi:hypothetical protein
MAPLWLVFKNATAVALAGRAIVCFALLFALVRLARALDIGWLAFAAGLIAWVHFGQRLGAGEWVFEGVEAKCIAYAFLVLALTGILNQQFAIAGVFSGLAILFHSAVGGWGAIALGGALSLRLRKDGLRRLIQFCGPVVAFSLPVALVTMGYMRAEGPPAGLLDTNQLIVLFRNPHHIDPNYFGGWREIAVAAFMACVTAIGLRQITTPYKTASVASFLLMLLGEFGAGLIARRCGWLWFLKAYPFRVADVMAPLLFWLVLPGFGAAVVNGLLKRFDLPVRRKAWLTIGLVCAIALAIPEIHALGRFARIWSEHARSSGDAWGDMTHWIRDHTPRSAIFIAPPWEDAFWLEAERAEVVNFKHAPNNDRIQEWYTRLVAVNGAPFRSVGFRALNELRQHYAALDRRQLENIRNAYGADYYLTTSQRPDLSPAPAHCNGAYFLYDLHTAGRDGPHTGE